MIKRSIASVLDQAMLSGLNFSAGLYLISTVPKGAYGLYVQLFAVGVLFCGVVDALIAHALTHLSSRHPPDVMALKTVMAQGIARLLAVLLAVLGGGLALGLQWDLAPPPRAVACGTGFCRLRLHAGIP
jgi:O-antigen/teichoic acid export membrane protein